MATGAAPATQAWKRERLAEVGIPLPACLTFAPVDFERQALAGGLQAAGFDSAQPTFFTWLGVLPYLSEEAVWSALGFIAGLPNGARMVFDYADPPESMPPEIRARHDRRAARVAGLGEPWIDYFEPSELHARLRTTGFPRWRIWVLPRSPPGTWAPPGPVPSRSGHILDTRPPCDSLRAQRLHRVDPRRPPRRQISGCQRRRQQ